MNTFTSLAMTASNKIKAAPLCMPSEVNTALDTAKLWCTIVAAGLAVVALIMVGIGMFFQNRRGDGGEILAKLGWWIFGCVLIAAASGIAAVFIPTDTSGCVDSL